MLEYSRDDLFNLVKNKLVNYNNYNVTIICYNNRDSMVVFKYFDNAS